MIRKIKLDDHNEWLRLRKALWPDTSTDEHQQEMREILSNIETTPVFVAVNPAGGLCGLLEVSFKAEAEGCETNRIGYLEGWYVEDAWREKGVGRKLVSVAEDWARGKGCTEMGSDTTSDYPFSKAAHQSLGYTVVKEYIHFKKDL